MCFDCHQKISNDSILEMLKEVIKEPKYELWNSTSVDHLIIARSGYNGNECAELAKKILDNYIDNNQNNKNMIDYINKFENMDKIIL
jgi:hypothetical protein